MAMTLREMRELKKISASELSKRTGISYPTILDYDNRITIPSVDYALMIADVLGVEVEDIDW